MFKSITLKNFRSHKSTTIELRSVTLFIGNNNSGKTNFLAGINHFCSLIKRGYCDNEQTVIATRDLYPHQHKFATDRPICFEVQWESDRGKITYEIEIYPSDNFPGQAGCKEKIIISLNDVKTVKEITSGYDTYTDKIALKGKIEDDNLMMVPEKQLCDGFFGDLIYTFYYHFQPSFLKGLVEQDKINQDKIKLIDKLTDNSPEKSATETLIIPEILGFAGGNFQKIIAYLTQTKNEKEKKIFTRFIALMRRFNANFSGTEYEPNADKITWLFDLGRKETNRPIDGFSTDVLSDGFLKAGAISLLVSLSKLPALILIEEIENGINPGNIQELLNWIWQTTSTSGYAPQFIITSHSPSVLREFHNCLDNVYTFRLDKRAVQSDVRNLNNALDTLVGIGTVEGDILEDETTGKRIVKIPKYQLAELWYSGTIG